MKVVTAVFVVSMFGFPAQATTLDEVEQFLKTYVLGKKFHKPEAKFFNAASKRNSTSSSVHEIRDFKRDGNKLEFSRYQETTGFSVNLDADGKEIESTRTPTPFPKVTVKYLLSQRKSRAEVVGVSFIETSGSEVNYAEANSLEFELTKDQNGNPELTTSEKTIGFTECLTRVEEGKKYYDLCKTDIESHYRVNAQSKVERIDSGHALHFDAQKRPIAGKVAGYTGTVFTAE